MIARNPRQKCECGASYRYDVDFQEHKRLGCKIESGKGDSLAADPDESPEESNAEAAVITEGEQCHYCKQSFPKPVSLHHSEEECQATLSKEPKIRKKK